MKSMRQKDRDEMKEQMEEMFRHRGFDIDLSSINFTDAKDEIERKMFESMQSFLDKNIEPPVKPKDKKQLQKEEKAKQLETLKEKGLSTLYKHLAKTFHPDLEQSPELKIEKEKLMKRLTHAYENDDLYAILTLRWNGQKRKKNITFFNHSQLNVYNSILKDQINGLEECIRSVFSHPKYFPLEPHIANTMFGVSMRQSLDISHRETLKDIKFFESLAIDLQGDQAEEETIKEILDAFG